MCGCHNWDKNHKRSKVLKPLTPSVILWSPNMQWIKNITPIRPFDMFKAHIQFRSYIGCDLAMAVILLWFLHWFIHIQWCMCALVITDHFLLLITLAAYPTYDMGVCSVSIGFIARSHRQESLCQPVRPKSLWFSCLWQIKKSQSNRKSLWLHGHSMHTLLHGCRHWFIHIYTC